MAKPARFSTCCLAPQHSLILFAASARGDHATELASAAGAVVEAHGHWIDVFVVMDRALPFTPPSDVTIIEDPKRSLYQRYGADTASLYLIRPDGYVAYRSRQLDSLGEYLDRVR